MIYWKFKEKKQSYLAGPYYIYAKDFLTACDVFCEDFDNYNFRDDIDIREDWFLELFTVESVNKEEISELVVCSDDHDWEVEHGKINDDDECFTCSGDKVIEVQLAKGKDAFVICHGWDI